MSVGREKVQCPICDRSVPSSEINLHLDLQCPGPGSPSQPTSAKSRSPHPSSTPTLPSRSQAPTQGRAPSRSPVKDELEAVVVAETPVRPSARGRLSGADRGAVAPIFAGRKRVKEEEQNHDLGRTAEEAGRSRRSLGGLTSAAVVENGPTEKRQRINPVVAAQPLAERTRPSTLSTYIGQGDLVGPGSLLRARIEAGEGVGSCILWGPPGCGKTTLARLIAKTANADFKELSATSSGTADVRQVFEQAKNSLKLTGRRTILMIDEIHRFNKSQQDLFLPYVENGSVQLIGATTENPSFKVNGALLSRCQVFTLSKHGPDDLLQILTNALACLPTPLPHLPPDLLPFLADVADGDARQALNGLELALKVCGTPLYRQATLSRSTSKDGDDVAVEVEVEVDPMEQKKRDNELMDAVRRGLRKGYDRSGEERYDMISALHKCLRGSDGSAAMYWLARMITGGEDALYIARRLVVVASEDVGLADNHALPLAMATYQACQVIGLPECRINLAHCVAYLAEAPKSTRSYTAYKRAEALAQEPPLPGVPLQIRNAPTQLMKKLGYGKHYSYDPNFAHPVFNEYLPFQLARHSSHSGYPDEQILKPPEAEQRDKEWDEDRLAEWEWRVNGSKPWEGREQRQGQGQGQGQGQREGAGGGGVGDGVIVELSQGGQRSEDPGLDLDLNLGLGLGLGTGNRMTGGSDAEPMTRISE